MNHKEIMEKISELEQQIAELKEAAQKQYEPKAWKPYNGDQYFFIDSCLRQVVKISKDIKHRNPVLSSGFHTDIKAIVQQQPIAEAMQVMIVSRETFLLVMRLNTVRGRNNCSDQKTLVDINTTTYWINDFQWITF